MIRLRRGVPVFACRCGALKLGENTLTVDGAEHLLKWRTTSGTPAQAGDVGMDLATGRLRMFVGGAVKDVAHTGEISNTSHFEYAGEVGIDTDLVINPAITNNQSLFIECTAQWAANADAKIIVRVRDNGTYNSTGYFYGQWSNAGFKTVNNTTGIAVIWRDSNTADRKFYAKGLLRCFGASGVRYLGMSTQFAPGGGVEVIGTHSGWRESFTTGSIDGVRFERTVAGTLSSFIARVWRVKKA